MNKRGAAHSATLTGAVPA